MQPYQNLSALKKIPKEQQKDWASYFITRGFNAVEKLLSANSGKYCVGDEITIADCCLVPQVFHAMVRFNVDLQRYPNILRIDQGLNEHPAFRVAHPDSQPDCPAKN